VLFERHLHAALEDRADVREGAGERPETEHGQVLGLSAEDQGTAEAGTEAKAGGGAGAQKVAARRVCVHESLLAE
jgi:hypothetical protein